MADNREEMVNKIREYGVKDTQVIKAIQRVDRAIFVRPPEKQKAYEDTALPIGLQQTISQPYTVAAMIEMLVRGGKPAMAKDRVLEIGTGSGYEAAILSKLFETVWSIEIIPVLAQQAKKVLAEAQIENVRIKIGDGKKGWKEQAPYPAIIVSADAEEVPRELIEQLGEGGRIVIPIKGKMKRGVKNGMGKMEWEELGKFEFVPLV